eukprot:g39444.t1
MIDEGKAVDVVCMEAFQKYLMADWYIRSSLTGSWVSGVAMGTRTGPSYACLFMGDRLATNIHYKPTDSHSYLDYTFSYPASCKDSIPFFQFLRLCRIHSNEANFDKGAPEMSIFFLNRGLPSTVVDRALNRVRPISCTSALFLSRNSDRVPLVLTYRVLLVLTYHPTGIHIQEIIRHHCHHFQRDATTRHIFPSPPLSTFYRDSSLQDTLVHSSFTPDNPQCPTAPSPATSE